MPRRLLLLLAALTALMLAGVSSAFAAAGAQNGVRSFTEAAPTHARVTGSESSCTHQGSIARGSGLAAGFCVAAEDEAVVAGEIGPAGNPGALATHDHHIFPQQFRSFFSDRGINIDDYTVQLGVRRHLAGVHGNGADGLPGGWNAMWRQFIQDNPNATAQDIYQYGGQLMDRYGLSGQPIGPYGGPH